MKGIVPITLAEATRRGYCSRSMLIRRIKSGGLIGVKEHGRWMLDVSSLEASQQDLVGNDPDALIEAETQCVADEALELPKESIRELGRLLSS